MILLKLQLTLQCNKPEPAVAASPFLGGVLHGIFEHTVISHAPIIRSELGITPGSQLKHYAILPPPYAWQIPTTPEPLSMQCGIILYGQARQYTKVVIALLKKWDEIRLEGRTDKIQDHQIHYLIPGSKTPSWHEVTQDTSFDSQPYFTNMHQTCENITINLFTPLKLGSAQQIATDMPTTSPPSLLQLVRSIARRIKKLEPNLCTSLGIESLAWTEAEELIRHIPIGSYQLKQVHWKYGSSTKQHLIPCTGLLGQIHYTGHIPATIKTLLHWGRWFGIGQSTALGQGMYYVDEPLINLETNEPKYDNFHRENQHF